MKSPTRYFFRIFYTLLPILALVGVQNTLLRNKSFHLAGFNSLEPERNAHTDFDDPNKPDLPSGPMDLMNAIRRATAMDDATNPTDALDEAIHNFNSQEQDNLVIPPVN
ncbi:MULTISPECIES: hypothetical protein [Prochlorococcus]|uniref:hypothetical protein n=1 Tax=Prochlorococcus TaxID=1218 RepID=UPI00053381F7|nr:MULTISPECIES: hypothetical protein [Prochlorococcus]KGG12907.1 hypothetical protein EV05_0580 [Prochlorococcus sp. MIT 0601]